MENTPATTRGLRLALCLLGLGALALVASPEDARAQAPRGNVGLGGQIGEPSGLTLKVYRRPGFAYDFLAAWDLDDFFFLNVHGLYERPLEDSPLRWYLGPGGFVGIANRGRGDDEVVLGVSATVGLNFFAEQFEVFLQLTPRLALTPDTDGDLGGGIGLRYYFE